MNQEAKHDEGKEQLTLVPRQIIHDIARVRMFGTEKYKDPDNWKLVEKERYRDAAFRHFLRYLDDPQGVDDESGLSHLAHLACNIAFLCELEAKEQEANRNGHFTVVDRNDGFTRWLNSDYPPCSVTQASRQADDGNNAIFERDPR